MKFTCPTKNLQEWKELESTVPDMAYTIWDLNKGEGIDRAPNGAPSILFLSLLDELGDRTEAIRAKANVYRQSFFRWFGDWIHHPELASKMVDENGEPRVFFHGGAKAIEAFRLSSETQSNTGYGYYKEPGTERLIPIDSNRSMFFSTSKGVAQSYRILNGLETALRLERRVSDIISRFNKTGRIKVDKELIESTDEFYTMLDDLSYFNPRFSKLKDYIKKIRETGGRLNEKESKAAGEMFKDVLEILREYDNWSMNLSDWVDIVPRAHKFLERYNNPEGIKRLLNGEIPLEILYEWDIYKKIEKNREKQGLSKIANYERLHFDLTHSGRYYFVYDGNRLKVWDNDGHEDFFVTDATEERLRDFINRALARNEADLIDLDNNEKLKFFFSRTELYPVFLNVRNPLVHDYEGTHQGRGYKESLKYPFGYVAARQVDKAINDGNDGVVYEDLYDPFLAHNVGVFDPNQIKSIYNSGAFSTEDNRIKYGLPLNPSVPYQSKPLITVNVQEIEQVDDKLLNVLNFLQKRFPQLKLQWIDAEQIPNGIRKDANAFVVDGVVYLVRGKVTPKTSIEEFLHPLVEALYEDNPTQFNALVAEAKLTYPKLWRAIQAAYKGFSLNTKEQELVAHALSEALNDRFENEANKSVFKQLVNGFVAWLKEVVAKAINYFESKFTKKSNNLKNLTLEDLADSIFNSDKEYRLKLDGDVKYNISEETTQMLDKARKGIQQRIRSLRHYSNPNIRLIQQMERLLDDLNKLDAIEGTQELLQYIINSLPDAAAFLQQSMDDINTKQLVQMRRDYLSFFIPILQDLQYLIDTTDELKSLPDYDKFAYSVEHALTLSNLIINKFNNIIKAKCKLMLLDYGEAAGSPTIKETVAELDNPANDLNWLETFLGLNSSAGNEVIRIMTDILNTAINKTKRETFSDGMRLVDLYNAAKQANPDIDVQKLLQEVDENGLTTGYFTRSRNWGKFYRDQLKFLDLLENELGIERSPEGELIFKDNELKREYVKCRTYWQLEHGVLKYTKKYYDAKFKMSIEAQEALDEVNHAIQLIRSRAQVGKHFLAHLLTNEERAQLKDLLKLKAYLSSEYDYNGNKKEGQELKIAQEIAQFREYIGEYLNYDVDLDRYNRDAQYMIKKYGVNSLEYRDWLTNSTEEAYDQEFYDELELIFGTASKRVQELRKKRARLLAPYKNSNNKEDLDDIPFEVRQLILELDQELSEFRNKLDKEQFERFSKIASIKYTDKYYEDADKARAEGRYDEWYAQNHYTNEDGYSVAASYYTYLVPKNPAYYTRIPNYFYKKVSSESPLINSEFDIDGPYVQPSKREYDNTEAWNKIQNNPTIKALYDALTEAMRDANNRISFFETNRDGRLPLISGRMMATLARADNKFEALKYIVKDSFMVKDDDVDYVEEYQYRNDGTPIKLVPTRFIKLLDNPAMITSDVVGSVIQFIEMSRNYQNMSDIQNDLELLMYRLGLITIKTKRGTKVGSETNIYKKAESLLDMVLYGKRSERLIIHGVDVTKALNKLYNYISLSNLAYNMWAIGTNYITGQGTLDIEAIAGKYFNNSDVTFAKKEFLQHFGNVASNIGNVNNKDKVSLLMLLLQVSRSNLETFDRLDQSRVLRGINQHFWYNGYSAGDFCVKGLLMLAVLHSYKLVDGEFLTEEQYVARSTDKNAARKHFKALQTTLYDMMDVVDGDIKIVAPEALKQATQRALSKALKKIQVLAGRIDGNITDTDRAMIHQGVLTRFLTMHRNFMIVGLQERLKRKQFNYSTGTMEGGVYADFLRYFGTIGKCFALIFTQGNINFIGNCLAQYKELNAVELYNVRRTLLDMMNIALWSVAIAPFFVFLAEDGGDDDWGLQAMAYLSMRVSFEFRSLYNPLELTNLLNSPSAAVSTLGLLFNMIKLIFPSTYLRENSIFSDVKSGAYKGWPRILRNIIKMTPAKNVYEFFSTQGIENKRTYLENQLMF